MAPKNNKKSNIPESPGKFLIALGGGLGFGVTFGVSMLSGGDHLKALVAGSFVCLICAFVMKQFARYIEKNIDEILNRKADEIRARRERAQAEDDDIPITFPEGSAKVPTAGELES